MLINPFSEDAKKLLEDKTAKDIEDICYEHATKIIDFKDKKIPYFLNENYDEKKDVLAQHYIIFTCAISFSPYSKEYRFVKQRIENLFRERLRSFGIRERERVIDLIKSEFDLKELRKLSNGDARINGIEIKKEELRALSLLFARGHVATEVSYAVKWKSLIPLLRARALKLTELYIINGYALLSFNEVLDFYSKIIGAKVEETLLRIYERAGNKDVELTEKQKKLAEKISKLAEESIFLRDSKLAGKQAKLNQANFPPCIKIAMQGVGSGLRNFAITMLLTSFISYARIAPPRRRDVKISDFISDAKILDEILSLIYEAAEKCNPPLFSDQPLEKQNILYHLGFGLAKEAKLENAGASKWYFPPNCEKIRREAPALCSPDETCSRIRNPLTYYFLKQSAEAKEKRSRRAERYEIKEIEGKSKSKKLHGKITKIFEGSGLIQRCPECSRRIKDSFCPVHGDVIGMYDFRIKAKLEDSEKRSYNLIFKKEEAEKAAKITLEEAKKIGFGAALNKIKEHLLGNFFETEVVDLKSGNFLVKEVKPLQDEQHKEDSRSSQKIS